MKKVKSFKNAKVWLRSLFVALIVASIGSILYFTGLFTTFENKTYDQRMIFASAYKEPCEDIIFIGVDQASIDFAQKEYGWGWPWPREAYGRMVDFISAGNPQSILFDILFTEPSVYGPSDDKALADSEKRSGKVIQTIYITEEGDNLKAQLPIPQIKDNAALLGNISSIMDEDDIIRRGRVDYLYEGKVYPTLGTAPLILNGLSDLSDIKRLKDGSVLLRYQRNMNDYYPYSAGDILSSYDSWKKGEKGIFSPEDFVDSYVYIAYYAPGLFDICSTPVSQVFPGVGVHITTLDNYLTDSFMTKVPEFIVCLWFFVISLLASALVAFASSRTSQKAGVIFMSLGFILLLAIVIVLPYLLFAHGIWLNLVGAVFTFVVTFLVCVILSFAVEGKQKRFIKSAFSQCLSKDVVNQIMNDPASFTLGGKKFQMSAIFTDIRKFSSFSELLTASQLGNLLNFYLTRLSEIIIAEHGTVDKYEGDAIVALVGAPVEMADHAERACSAAIKMKKAEALMNQEILKIAAKEKPSDMSDDLYYAFKILVANNKTIFTRIGINSGEMIAGYFGSENKKNYTMMGSNVNLASRLEGVNKQYSTGGILISEHTRALIGDRFLTRKLDRVRVVNVNTPIRLYELLDENACADESFKAYAANWDKAMELFEAKDYAKALEMFRLLQQKWKSDNVALYYIALIEKYFIKGTYPTESDDEGVAYNPEDGVFKLLQK
ncbi:MAG: CHASE2 domain-containing protein [Treponema sp.]|nr:CHASE2 domain-containing protein [Treponema sp.]